MISDKILYNKQIELYVKQMFQLKLFDNKVVLYAYPETITIGKLSTF